MARGAQSGGVGHKRQPGNGPHLRAAGRSCPSWANTVLCPATAHRNDDRGGRGGRGGRGRQHRVAAQAQSDMAASVTSDY